MGVLIGKMDNQSDVVKMDNRSKAVKVVRGVNDGRGYARSHNTGEGDRSRNYARRRGLVVAVRQGEDAGSRAKFLEGCKTLLDLRMKQIMDRRGYADKEAQK